MPHTQPQIVASVFKQFARQRLTPEFIREESNRLCDALGESHAGDPGRESREFERVKHAVHKDAQQANYYWYDPDDCQDESFGAFENLYNSPNFNSDLYDTLVHMQHLRDRMVQDAAEVETIREELGLRQQHQRRAPQRGELKQIIYYGAPGTGKSHKIDYDLFVDANGNGAHLGLRSIDKDLKFRTTFHPDYDYAQFVGSYKPVETASIPTLDKDSLYRELRRFLAEESPNAIHKFAAYYFNSLKKMSAEEKRELFNNANVSDATQSAEIPKGMAVGEFVNVKKNISSITYSFVPQIFAKSYVKAWTEYLKALNSPDENNAENVYLVIEEINRGNCAQIFGDIFQLLDRKEGHSDYPIDIDSDFAGYVKEQLSKVRQADGTIVNYWSDYKNKIQEWDSPELGEELSDGDFCKIALPPNFNILATMNTSDQSLFPMDNAFKRRFDWEHVPIKYKKDDTCGIEWNADQFVISVGDSCYNWLDFLEKVNKNVYDVTKSEDKQMGEFFIKHSVDYKQFRSKVLFYLWDSVYKDEEGNKDAEKVFHFKLDGEEKKTLTFQTLFEGNDDIQKKRIKEIMSKLEVQDQSSPSQQGEQEANGATTDTAPAEEENLAR